MFNVKDRIKDTTNDKELLIISENKYFFIATVDNTMVLLDKNMIKENQGRFELVENDYDFFTKNTLQGVTETQENRLYYAKDIQEEIMKTKYDDKLDLDISMVTNGSGYINLSNKFEISEDGRYFRLRKGQIVRDEFKGNDGREFYRYKILIPTWLKIETEYDTGNIRGIERRTNVCCDYGDRGYCHLANELCTGNFNILISNLRGDPNLIGGHIFATLCSSNPYDEVGYRVLNCPIGFDLDKMQMYDVSYYDGDEDEEIDSIENTPECFEDIHVHRVELTDKARPYYWVEDDWKEVKKDGKENEESQND